MEKNKRDILSEWVELYGDDLYRWTYYKVSNQEAAEDLVQDTFLAAFNGYDQFQGNSNPKTWLFSILKRKIIDYYRSQASNKIVLDADNQHENRFFNEKDEWINQEAVFGEEQHLLDNHQFNLALEKCIAHLPKNWSYAIRMKFLSDKSSQEICQELGVSSSNYWQILHRAKLQLKDCLNKNWFNRN